MHQPQSCLHLPGRDLASCIFATFMRDTRGCDLGFEDRFNFFGASPLCAISWSLEGTGHVLSGPEQFSNPAAGCEIPGIAFSGPQQKPVASWNPGPVNLLMVTFYPEAFHALTGVRISDYLNRTVPVEKVLSGELLHIVQSIAAYGEAEEISATFEAWLRPRWRALRPRETLMGPLVSDWTNALASRAYLSAVGKSVRQVERRIKNWTGQSHKTLATYARLDKAYQEALDAKSRGDLNLADLSYGTGYSDQPHLTRQVRALTGFSPAELMHRIENEEAFWSFRLLGQRY